MALFRRLLCCLLFAATPLPLAAQTLMEGSVLDPELLQADAGSARMPSFRASGNGKVWIAYTLVAVEMLDAAEDSPLLAVEAMPEGVAVPMAQSRLVFRAEEMDALPVSDELQQRVSEQMGDRSDDELREALGDDMFEAYLAVMDGRATPRMATRIREYQFPTDQDLELLVSFPRIVGLQPLALQVEAGQGEVPPRLRGMAEGGTPEQRRAMDKLVASAMTLGLIVAFVMWRRRRR